MQTTDIDIDFANRDSALDGLSFVPASLVPKNGERQRHPSGVYFQDIPVDPFTGNASFDYKKAESLGYFKIDFLNVSLYEHVRDEAHLDELLARDPDWTFFEHAQIVARLSHVRDHFGVVQTIQPKCILDLAVVIALIRPGKRHLLAKSRAEIDAEIWKIDPNADSGYVFKKAHAVSYAASIVVQLNMICDEMARSLETQSAIS